MIDKNLKTIFDDVHDAGTSFGDNLWTVMVASKVEWTIIHCMAIKGTNVIIHELDTHPYFETIVHMREVVVVDNSKTKCIWRGRAINFKIILHYFEAILVNIYIAL